ncbi:DUF2254 family protein [Thioalkalivibrio sp. XN8]|uniref:DUF2254 family protein n=1 Tax=Thioalkalivibrio sp. XN8 TaxID=2712863 RepID=UPI0013EDAD3C|nr:DUF2254 family protein [Thioalkalivibrio sp. XN8]NGP52888.1 DUF2254 domain-containing protein [Thioalkalivibrio sp. XN8]
MDRSEIPDRGGRSPRHPAGIAAPRTGRAAAPPVVRTWILPMVIVIAIAVFFCTAFYVIDAIYFGAGLHGPLGLFEHYLSFDAELITDALPALGMTIVAVLGIVLTVVAIIVQLSSERYTSVAIMFLREPVHIAVISFYIVASLCAVWLSVTLRPDFVPRSLLLLVMILTSLGLAVMLPYFAYTFWFLEPGNIIDRLRRHTTQLTGRGLAAASTEEAHKLQGRVLEQMEEITDIANNSIEGRDKIIAGRAIDALCDFTVHYIATKPREDLAWYHLSPELRANPDFVAMDRELLAELEARRLWVEWKTLHEFLRVYHEALESMGDIDSQVAIDTRYLAEAGAVHRETDLIRMVFRFLNSYLRAAIDRRIEQTADAVLLQYRMLIEELLRRDLCDEACEGVRFLKFYGYLAFEDELSAITETVAYDIASLCRYAHSERLGCDLAMLRELLALDAEEASHSHRHYRGLRGVRKAQIRLGVYYLSEGEEQRAQLIADDMADMSEDSRATLREELMTQAPPHFWEIVDRGRNLHYLTDSERAHLDRFFQRVGAPGP